MQLRPLAFAFAITLISIHLLAAPLDDLGFPDESNAPEELTQPKIETTPSDVVPGTPTLDLGLFPQNSATEDSPEQADEMSKIFAAAWAAFRAGDSRECSHQLRQLVARNPNFPPPDLILIEFHLDAGQRRRAHELLEAFAAEDATHPQLYLSYARLALAEGRYTEALLHFEKMDQLGPPRGWSDEQQLEFQASVLSGKATVAERRGNWDSAARVLTELSRLQSSDVHIRNRLGRALLLDDRQRQAYEQFDIAYRQDPTVNHPDVAMGTILLGQGKVEKANEHFETALKELPDDGPLNYAWSMSLLYQDRLQEADTFAKKAEATGIKTHNLLLQRGRIAWALGRHDEAERYFQQLVDSSPANEVAKFYLVLSKASQGDRESRTEAQQIAEEFVKASPNSAAAVAALGYTQYALGENAQAEATLGRVAAFPNVPLEILLAYGKVLAINGDTEQAKQVAEQLDQRMRKTNIFLTRRAAKTWIESMRNIP